MGENDEKLEMLCELEQIYCEGCHRRKHLNAISNLQEIKFELELVKYQKRQAEEGNLAVDVWSKCFLALVSPNYIPPEEKNYRNSCEKVNSQEGC